MDYCQTPLYTPLTTRTKGNAETQENKLKERVNNCYTHPQWELEKERKDRGAYKRAINKKEKKNRERKSK